MAAPSPEKRAGDIERFYALLDELEERLDGARRLADSSGHMGWPKRGVYFFREPQEVRTDTGTAARIVRVGTHGLKAGSRSTLWGRLAQHKGTARSGGGNHRGSIFRLVVGASLMARDGPCCSTWGQGSSAPREVREGERSMEQAVSDVVGEMPFLWLAVEDDPGPSSSRGYIERNAIALLSNYGREPIDPPSTHWLGHFSDREKIAQSGLWNSNHVEEDYEPVFLNAMQQMIESVGACRGR